MADKDKRRNRIMISLVDSEYEALEKLARGTHIPLATYVQQVVTLHLKRKR